MAGAREGHLIEDGAIDAGEGVLHKGLKWWWWEFGSGEKKGKTMIRKQLCALKRGALGH